MILEQFYTKAEVAEKLQCNERFIGDNIRDKKLKAYKLGKRHYILHSDLVNFIKTGKANF